MSLNVGSLWANLSLNITQFTASLSQAQAQVRTTGQQMQTALGRGPSGAINNTSNALNNLNNQVNRTGKDFQRVVGGILMAQAFYRLTNAIQESAKAVIDFSNNMVRAQISMEYFLGSKERAQGFLDVMKDFAATTPFTTDQSVSMTRRLMAMGFAAESVKSVMGTLVDASSATGGTAEQMDRIVLALGQMKTNGYIAGQELRQLAEAGIPAYRILKEELGLTTDQLRKIGKLKISGDLGVAAVLKGLEKRYKGAAKRIAETIPGMWSTIKDDFLIISEQMIKGTYGKFEVFLRGIRDKFEVMRQALRSGGLGKMFETMFPPELHGAIRNIIASFRIITSSVGNVAKALAPVVGMVGGIFISTLGKVLPIVAAVIKVLSSLIVTLITAVPGIKLFVGAIMSIMVAQLVAKTLMFFWTVVRAGAICSFVAQAVTTLTRAIQFLYIACTRNPIIGIVMLIAGALLALALSSKTVTQWLDQVTGRLSALAGVDPGGILDPENNKELSKWTDEFNKSLSDMNKNLKGVGKEAEKAGKKTKDKFLASFDEVFQVPEKLDEAGDAFEDMGVGFGEMPDFKMPNLKDMLPDLSGLDSNPFDNMPPMIPARKNPPKGPSGNGGNNNTPPPDASVISDMVDTIETLIARARKAIANMWPNPFPVPEIVLAPIEGLLTLLERVKTAARDIKTTFANFVVKAIKIPEIEQTKTSLSGLKDAFMNIPDLFKSFVTAFKQLAIKVGPVVVDFIKAMAKAMATTITEVGKWLGDHWKEILLGVLLAALAVVLFIFGGEIVAGIGALGAGALAALESLGGVIAGFFSGGLVASTAGSISAGFMAILGGIVAAIVAMGPVIASKWDEITSFFSTTWTTIKTTIATAMDTIKTKVTTTTDAIKNSIVTAWNTVKTTTSTVWNGIKTNVSTAVNTIKTTVPTAINGVKTTVTTAWNTIKSSTSTVWSGIKTTISNIVNGIKGIFEGLKKSILGIWDGIGLGIKKVLNVIIDGMNTMIEGMNKLSFDVPEWVPGAGGKSFGFKLDKIPHLAKGGIINKDQLIRAGEGNKSEVMIPLENSTAMRPFSAAVASDLMELLTGTQGATVSMNRTEAATDTRPVYFITADERSLRDLERRLKVIRLNEGVR